MTGRTALQIFDVAVCLFAGAIACILGAAFGVFIVIPALFG